MCVGGVYAREREVGRAHRTETKPSEKAQRLCPWQTVINQRKEVCHWKRVPAVLKGMPL